MASFESLINEHDVLLDHIAAMTRLCDFRQPRPRDAIYRRLQFIESLDAHLAAEDHDVYPRLMTASDAATAALATRFHTEFGGLVDDWVAYLDRWPGRVAADDWAGFCSATLILCERLKRRINEENALLYPLALRASVITLRTR